MLLRANRSSSGLFSLLSLSSHCMAIDWLKVHPVHGRHDFREPSMMSQAASTEVVILRLSVV